MKIGILGLGLIGGSIFKNLQEHKKSNNNIEVFGVSRSVNGENISSDYGVLACCDLVFVCTPMNKTLEILEKIEKYLNNDTIVTDVCSLKEFVTHKKYNYKFIPSHPMAGTEFSGWEHSFPELFNNAIWAITPLDGASLEDIDSLKSIIKILGAKPIITTPEEHDEAVGLISHAPLVIAQAMCKSIENNALAQELASSGFRDTTRLALSNIEMANDMVCLNKQNIKNSIEMLNKNLEFLLSTENYPMEAQNIKIFRQDLYK